MSLEPGTFIYREGGGQGRILGTRVTHDDDVLIGVAPGAGDFLLGKLAEAVDLGSLQSCQEAPRTFCGCEYAQKKDYTVEVTMRDHVRNMETLAVPRARTKTMGVKLTPAEHRGFRKVLGQLHWAARMM